MMEQNLDIVAVIEAEIEKRRQKNPSLSLRSFARFLGVSPATLSQILTRKRKITPAIAVKFVEKCNFNEQGKAAFLSKALGVDFLATPPPAYKVLTGDEFAEISDWYFFAILCLCECEPSEPLTLEVIADRLGIAKTMANEAVAKLARLDIVKVQKGIVTLERSDVFSTAHDVPDATVRKYHKQVLHKTIEAIDAVPPDKREVAAVTMAVNPEHLAEAKKHLREFLAKMNHILSKGPASEVYTLQLALIPVTKAHDHE